MPPGNLLTLQVSPVGKRGKGGKQPQEMHKANLLSHGKVVADFLLVDLLE